MDDGGSKEQGVGGIKRKHGVPSRKILEVAISDGGAARVKCCLLQWVRAARCVSLRSPKQPSSPRLRDGRSLPGNSGSPVATLGI